MQTLADMGEMRLKIILLALTEYPSTDADCVRLAVRIRAELAQREKQAQWESDCDAETYGESATAIYREFRDNS